MPNFTPTIAGVPLPFCLMNAAGALSTSKEELMALARSESGAVVTKSITTAPFEDPGARCGLENPGYAWYVKWMPEILRTGKPVIASVAGFSVEEYIEVAQALAAAGASLIEINLNDPHVHTHLNPFRSAGFLGETVVAIRQAVQAPLAVKLPPYVPLPLNDVAAALLEAAIPAAICHNASSNGVPSQAQTILHASSGKLAVIGVGSVSSTPEALAALHSGIKAIQIGSAVVKEGVDVFARLKQEMTVGIASLHAELTASQP
jgi:dihydroorotate dehydrogenase (fumarate)